MRRVHTILLLALLSAFPALSTDMYLAAIPLLVETWQQPLVTVNLTLVCFFLTYCFCLLLYGPLADRFGRRPPLLFGITLFVLASLFCALADSVEALIAARVLQGAGAASASAIALAICKDLYEGELRQRVFVQIGLIVAAAPMIGPMLGAWIIDVASWRLVFLVQVAMGLLSLIGVVRMQESLAQPNTEPLYRAVHGYLRLLANGPYVLLTLTFAAMGVPFFAFIAASSDIYITQLGYSERIYGYFFSFNSASFVLGPLLFSRLAHRYPLHALLPLGFVGMLAGSLLMSGHWLPRPYNIALPIWLFTFCFSFTRPPANNLILEQVDSDAGSAASFMVFINFITGALAMWAISFPWQDKIRVLGYCGVGTSTLVLLAWFLLRRWVSFRLPGPASR